MRTLALSDVQKSSLSFNEEVFRSLLQLYPSIPHMKLEKRFPKVP